MSKITKQQALQLAAHAVLNQRTVERIYAGGATKPIVLERLNAAAKALDLPRPPKPVKEVSK